MFGNFWLDVRKLPNIITLIRLFLGAPVTIVLYKNGFEYAWLVFLLFVATDWLDGFIARRQGSVTSLGMFLDPLADQFLVLPIFWYFWIAAMPIGDSPMIIIVPLFFTLREAVMLAIRLSAKTNMPAINLGKYKIVAEYAGIFLFLFIGNLYHLAAAAVICAIFFSGWSLLIYVDLYLEIRRGIA